MKTINVACLIRRLVPIGCVAVMTGAIAEGQQGEADRPSQSSQSSQSALVDTLNQKSLQTAFRMLRRRFLRKEALTYDELNRAALDGLLARLGDGAELVPDPSAGGMHETATELRMVSEMLTSQIVYVRPASLGGGELKAFDSVLGGFQRSPAEALILDLRSPGGVDRFHNATEFAGRFLPASTLLFQVQRPDDSVTPQAHTTRKGAIWKKRTVVLVDRDTGPAGEVLAACLRGHLGSVIIGETTRGRTVEYEEVPIGIGGLLRYAVAEVVLEDGSRLFQAGVVPDVESVLEHRQKRLMLVMAQEKGVRPCVFETERPRLNEAALVAGTHPELPYLLARGSGEESPFDSRPRLDSVIQTAVDVLAAIHRLENP